MKNITLIVTNMNTRGQYQTWKITITVHSLVMFNHVCLIMFRVEYNTRGQY